MSQTSNKDLTFLAKRYLLYIFVMLLFFENKYSGSIFGRYIIINKTKVLLPQAYVTLALGSPPSGICDLSLRFSSLRP
jgi:hypothetical protein